MATRRKPRGPVRPDEKLRIDLLASAKAEFGEQVYDLLRGNITDKDGNPIMFPEESDYMLIDGATLRVVRRQLEALGIPMPIKQGTGAYRVALIGGEADAPPVVQEAVIEEPAPDESWKDGVERVDWKWEFDKKDMERKKAQVDIMGPYSAGVERWKVQIKKEEN